MSRITTVVSMHPCIFPRGGSLDVVSEDVGKDLFLGSSCCYGSDSVISEESIANTRKFR